MIFDEDAIESRKNCQRDVIKTMYSVAMEKAYRNHEFLGSPEARPLRILAEYIEPKQRLAKLGIHKAITFWGSARIEPGHTDVGDGRDYYQLAYDLGRRLTEWTLLSHPPGEQYHILTGAGPGIMEAAHAGAASIDPGRNVGLNITLPHEQGTNGFIPPEQVFTFHYFFTRKFWFLNLSAALVVFPGGFGTLDELFEVLTLIQTGKARPRPVLLFGKDYWREVINLPALQRQGLISAEDLDMAIQSDDVDAAFDWLTAALTP